MILVVEEEIQELNASRAYMFENMMNDYFGANTKLAKTALFHTLILQEF